MIKVENHKDLVRDPTNNVILNVDLAALNACRVRNKILKQKDEVIADLSERVNRLEALLTKLTK